MYSDSSFGPNGPIFKVRKSHPIDPVVTVKVVVTVCKKLFAIGGGFSRHILWGFLEDRREIWCPQGKVYEAACSTQSVKGGTWGFQRQMIIIKPHEKITVIPGAVWYWVVQLLKILPEVLLLSIKVVLPHSRNTVPISRDISLFYAQTQHSRVQSTLETNATIFR